MGRVAGDTVSLWHSEAEQEHGRQKTGNPEEAEVRVGLAGQGRILKRN